MNSFTKPLISIIVPAYNVNEYLCKSVDSLLCQSYSNLEIILIDDGSTDSTGKLCDLYAIKDSRVKVIHQENQGVSSARNVALKVAKGDFVSFVDADDYVDATMYEVLVKNALKHNSDYVVTGFSIDKDISCSKSPVYKDQQEVFSWTKEDAIVDLSSLKSNFSGGLVCSKLIKTEIAKNVMFDHKLPLAEDQLFALNCILNSKKIIAVAGKPYHYIFRKNSASRSTINEKKVEQILSAYTKICNIVKNKLDSKLLLRFKVYSLCRCELYSANKLIMQHQNNSELYAKLKRNVAKEFVTIFRANFPVEKKFQLYCFAFTGRLYTSVLYLIKKKFGTTY